MNLALEDWTETRQQVLARDGHQCVACAIRDEELHVHHVLPRAMGGADDPGNLITLCAGCHAARHPKLSGTLLRRVVERWAVRLSHWLDREGKLCEETAHFGPALRLFGLQRFREGQLPVVQAALSGKSILVVSPTGFGKTLCFQLPALLRRSTTVVISPLKTLMADQVSSLLRKHIPATFINSDLGSDEKGLRYRLLERNGYKLLYVAPERFFVKSRHELERLANLRPSFFVVDEAHCVDQWGRDFRPEYGKLRAVREALGSPPVLAFTATAGLAMQERILASLGVEEAEVFVRGVNRPNIAFLRWRATAKERAGPIAEMLTALPSDFGKIMIFVPTVKIGSALQEELASKGHALEFYHSRQGTGFQREQLVKRFCDESEPQIDRIICTNAFGMGLDISNVRVVIHWQHPASVEDYVQEFGRAGRDGKPAIAVILHDHPRIDQSLLKFMAKQNAERAELSASEAAAALASRHAQIESMSSLLKAKRCFRDSVIAHFEIPKKPKRHLAQRLLEWVFSEKAPRTKSILCCDVCSPALLKEIGPCGFLRTALQVRATGTTGLPRGGFPWRN